GGGTRAGGAARRRGAHRHRAPLAGAMGRLGRGGRRRDARGRGALGVHPRPEVTSPPAGGTRRPRAPACARGGGPSARPRQSRVASRESRARPASAPPRPRAGHHRRGPGARARRHERRRGAGAGAEDGAAAGGGTLPLGLRRGDRRGDDRVRARRRPGDAPGGTRLARLGAEAGVVRGGGGGGGRRVLGRQGGERIATRGRRQGPRGWQAARDRSCPLHPALSTPLALVASPYSLAVTSARSPISARSCWATPLNDPSGRCIATSAGAARRSASRDAVVPAIVSASSTWKKSAFGQVPSSPWWSAMNFAARGSTSRYGGETSARGPSAETIRSGAK